MTRPPRRLLTDAEKDALLDRQAVLIDMVFNLGWAGFAKFARLRMALGRRDWDAASNEMRDSAWFKQVGNRSQRLCVMMRSGLWPA